MGSARTGIESGSSSQIDLGEWFQTQFSQYTQLRYQGPSKLHQALRYVCEGGGKKVRARFCLEAARLIDTKGECGLPGAIALELMHAYSLVHDDLPAMDNDDFRRGRPTVHRAFDEASAILVGDALQADAFSVLAGDGLIHDFPELEYEKRIFALRELALASGSQGMVLGQALDCFFTGKSHPSREQIEEIHLKKTGALFGASLAIGAILAGASTEEVQLLRKAGYEFGLAFQVIDDLIDNGEHTGKTKGKDAAQGKWSFLSVMNVEEAQRVAEELHEGVRSKVKLVAGDKKSLTLLNLVDVLLRRSA